MTAQSVVQDLKVRGSANGLPDGWGKAALGELCDTTSGGTPSRKIEAYFKGNIPWVKSGELPDGPVTNIEEFITKGAIENSSAKIFPAGTLLIALYGATVGKLGILTRPAATNQAVCAIFPRTELNTKYLFWYLQSARSELIAKAIGGAQPNISQGILRSLEVPVAPTQEQARIVAEIEKQFSRLDEGVASLKRTKANLKRYKAAVLKAAVEGKLTEEWRKQHPDVEPASKLLERTLSERVNTFEARSKKYKAPVMPEDTGSTLSNKWSWACWDQLTVWVTYGFTRPMPHVEHGIPIVTAKHVHDGRIDLEATEKTPIAAFEALSEKDKPMKGDILITKDGTIGRSAVVDFDIPFCINQSVAVAWLCYEKLNRKFLRLVIESPFTQRLIWAKARGVAIQHLSITDFARMPLPFPPALEQEEIVAEVERRVSMIDELETAVEANLTRADGLRQSILTTAFAGALTKHASIASSTPPSKKGMLRDGTH